ncbi:MAG: hypothetical protein IJU39_07580 [Clostridia bacterium]|nr:hypothetical protein [Clostridia bacterium]
MIVCLAIIALFVFKAEKWAFLCIPLCLLYVAVKSKFKNRSSNSFEDNPYDELFEDELLEDDFHKE